MTLHLRDPETRNRTQFELYSVCSHIQGCISLSPQAEWVWSCLRGDRSSNSHLPLTERDQAVCVFTEPCVAQPTEYGEMKISFPYSLACGPYKEIINVTCCFRVWFGGYVEDGLYICSVMLQISPVRDMHRDVLETLAPLILIYLLFNRPELKLFYWREMSAQLSVCTSHCFHWPLETVIWP